MTIIPVKTLNNGFSLPVFGLGTWGMGGYDERDTSQDAHNVAAIRSAIDAGITHIDTAEKYGAGHAEEIVGQAIASEDRSRLRIVSKVRKEHLRFDDVLRAAEGSLRRIGTDYLDMYLIHSFNAEVPISETMRAMDRLVDEGLVRNIGVSNFWIDSLEEAMQTAVHPIVTNQLQYSLGFREHEQRGLLQHAQKHDWIFTAWRPIRDVLHLPELPPVLRKLCDTYEKTPIQIALNWLMTQKNVVTIAKTVDRSHLEEMLGSLGWSLTPEDSELLRMAFPQEAGNQDQSN